MAGSPASEGEAAACEEVADAPAGAAEGPPRDGREPATTPVARAPHAAALQVQALVGGATGTDSAQTAITLLQAQRRQLNVQKKQLTRQLRNEGRKRQRILDRSQRLSNQDLVEVLNIRTARSAAAQARQAARPAPKR